jgi:hypothetical protein
VYGLMTPCDWAALNRPVSSTCGGTSSNERRYPWAPILAQNKLTRADNLFVLIPDFSYFSTFRPSHDHGYPEDEWFPLVHRERGKRPGVATAFYPREYQDKEKGKAPPPTSTLSFASPLAVWRGRVYERDHSAVRHALARCHNVRNTNRNVTGVDTSGGYVSKRDMCRDYKAIITVPGK